MGLFSSSKSSSKSYAYDQRSIADGEGISAANNAGTIGRIESGNKNFYAGESTGGIKITLAIIGIYWLLTRPKTKAILGKVVKKWKA